MATLSELKRTFMLNALGLQEAGLHMSNADLEIAFWSTATPGSVGANRFGFNSIRLPKFSAALAKTRDNAGDTKVMCVGDSQFAGVGTTLQGSAISIGCPPARLSQLLANAGIPSAIGLSVPQANDNRWTLGSGWTSTLFGIGSLACYTSPASAFTLTFTDSRVVWDKADIYMLQGSGLGTPSAVATGGSTATQSGNNVTQDVIKFTATAAAASAANTLIITPTVAQCYIVGVHLYNSTVSKVCVGTNGVGTTDTNAHVAASTTWGTIPTIKRHAPDLTIFQLGINDRGNSVPTATYRSNFQQLIAAAQISGDVMLTSSMPSGTSPQNINEPAYNTILANLGTAYYDHYGRAQSFQNYFNLGMTYDFLHPNNKGYWDWAQGMAVGLINV